MSLVFISYSRKDETFVRTLVGDLQRENINIWLDKDDIKTGERWDLSIEKALKRASHLLFVMSKNSVDSSYCRIEINLALNLGIPVLPILIEECTIPAILSLIQYTDFRGGYATQLQKLIVLLPRETRGAMIAEPIVSVVESAMVTPAQMAASIRQQIEASNRSQEIAQSTLIQLIGKAPPNSLKLAWREFAFDAQTDGVLADLASNSPDEQIRQNAARSIAALGSAHAVDQLVKSLHTNRQRVMDALVWAREAARTLPDGVPSSLRRAIFRQASIRQCFARPLDLLFRYLLAAVGFGIAVTLGIAANFGTGSGPTVLWRSAIALGIFFGLLMGVPITVAIELSRRLTVWNRVGRGALALAISAILVLFVLFVRYLMDLTSSAGGPFPTVFVAWSILFAANFALPPLFEIQPLEPPLAFLGVFAVVYLSNVFAPGDSLINYRTQPVVFSLLATVLIVGFTYIRDAVSIFADLYTKRVPRK